MNAPETIIRVYKHANILNVS